MWRRKSTINTLKEAQGKKWYCPLAQLSENLQKVKQYIAETTPALEPDKTGWKPANLGGLTLLYGVQ